MEFQRISAVTFAVQNMAHSVDFYQNIGLELSYGGADNAFTTFRIGKEAFLNLIATRASAAWWGRVIVRVQGVDTLYEDLKQKGLNPEAPRDGEWGERFFHIQDPDHHELSFAEVLT